MRQTGGGGLERAAASGPRRGAAFPGAFLVVATLALAVALEVAVRLTYRVRNALVDEIPLPCVFGQVYGPVPPWIDGLRFLEDGERLMWRNRPSVQRRYVDIFSPVQAAEDRFFIRHRFWPHLPESLAGNPVWTVSTNSEGFRDREFRGSSTRVWNPSSPRC